MTSAQLFSIVGDEWHYECMHCGCTYRKGELTAGGGLHCARCDELTETPQRVLYEPTIERLFASVLITLTALESERRKWKHAEVAEEIAEIETGQDAAG